VFAISAGGNNGNAEFGTLFGTGDGNAKWVDPLPASMSSNGNNGNAEFGTLFGTGDGNAKWVDPLPASMSSNSTSEWPASMSMSMRLLERMFRRNDIFLFCLLCPPPLLYICEVNCVGSDNLFYCNCLLISIFLASVVRFHIITIKNSV
jgi:hypothetical protein